MVKEGSFVDSNNILDLVVTTELNRIGYVSVLAPFPKCRHCPVPFEYVLQTCNIATDDNENEAVKKHL